MELHFCLSKWKTESIVCALIYPNAHLSEKIEFLPCINNSTHCATHCKPKIRQFAVTGCELTDVWFAYSLQLLSLLLLSATVAVSAADCFHATATAAVVASSTAVINAKKTSLRIETLWKCLRFVQLWMQYVITIPRILISISQWNILIIISYQLNWLENALNIWNGGKAPHEIGLKVETSNGMQTVQIIWLNFIFIEMQNQWHRTSTERKLKQRKHA